MYRTWFTLLKIQIRVVYTVVHEEQNLSANQHMIGRNQPFSYGDFLVDFFTLFYRENVLIFFYQCYGEIFARLRLQQRRCTLHNAQCTSQQCTTQIWCGGWAVLGCTVYAFRTCTPPPFQAIEIEGQRELWARVFKVKDPSASGEILEQSMARHQ